MNCLYYNGGWKRLETQATQFLEYCLVVDSKQSSIKLEIWKG